jgi:hypothetical protein
MRERLQALGQSVMQAGKFQAGQIISLVFEL